MKNIVKLVIFSFTAGMTTLSFAAETQATMTVSAASVQAATPTVEITQKQDNAVLISPRTNMRYVLSNPSNRTVIFQTDALAPVTAQNVNRITASNPALSVKSQELAEQALLDLAGIAAPESTQVNNVVTTQAATH